MRLCSAFFGTVLALCFSVLSRSAVAEMPPLLTSAFTPPIISTGQTSRLTFQISNPNASALTNISFTNLLSPNVLVAFPRNLTNGCGATNVLTGGGMIRVAGMHLEGGQSCVISLDMTSSTKGVHTNVIDGIHSTQSPPGPQVNTGLNVGGSSLAMTGAVTNILETSALVECVASFYGVASEIYFEFGRTTAYGEQTSPQHIAASQDALPVSDSLTGL